MQKALWWISAVALALISHYAFYGGEGLGWGAATFSAWAFWAYFDIKEGK